MYKKEIEKIEKAQKEIKDKIEFNLLKKKLDAIYVYVQELQNISDHHPLDTKEDVLLKLEEELKSKGVDDYSINKFDEWWEKHRDDTIESIPKE